MKKLAASVLALAGMVAMSGCASHHMSANSGPVKVSAEATLQANVEVGEDITGTANETVIFWFIRLGPSKFADGVDYSGGGAATGLVPMFGMEGVKAAAAYDALDGSGADVIMDARYTLDVTDYVVVKMIECTVTGKGATVSY